MACVYIDCNVQSGHIFRLTVKLMKLTAKRATGAKRPLITKLPTTPENPINVIKGTVEEIRKDDPAKPRGVDTVADRKQGSRSCGGRDRQEGGQPATERRGVTWEWRKSEGRTRGTE